MKGLGPIPRSCEETQLALLAAAKRGIWLAQACPTTVPMNAFFE